MYSTQGAFAARKSDGSVVTWGDDGFGADSSSVAGSLSSNVTAVYSNQSAFAALKKDGSLVAWGSPAYGGLGAPTGTGFTSVQSVFYYEPRGPSLQVSTGNTTATTATLLGEVAGEGKSPVTARGFVYALASIADPEIGDAGVTQVADNGSGLGSYSKLLSGLTPNTAYVFRAYVINEEGTTYSSAQNVSTNLAPVIIRTGGTTTVSLNVAENSTAVSTVSATDADAGQSITYSISGGADAARFAIGSTSGVVTFAAAPDFEAPADADANNVYTVIVQAMDNGNTPKSATQTLTVTVTNVLDNGILAVEQPAGTALASGNGSVGFGNLTIGQPFDITFTLRNQGEAALLLPSGVVISGAAASDYSVVGSVPASLATGGNTTLTVRFTPSASGNRSATLSIPTN
ncbi:MAG: choice-of-anchor D domain-containing protein, partial [Spartobacteria bacterium]